MTSTLTWGVLSTTSARSYGTNVGDAFGNPYSFADVNGVPYFWASNLDASMIDLFSGGSKGSRQASFALSEAELSGTTSSVPTCEIGSNFSDPENPPCARLILTGTVLKVPENSSEAGMAMRALVSRHPSFANYSGLGFYIAKMKLEEIFFIGAYGGPDFMALKDYFSAARADLHHHVPSKASRLGPPDPTDKVGVARWMARTLNYGFLSTTSTRSYGCKVGTAFGNPYSFADNLTGVPYFFASDLDASMIDLFVSSSANSRASFTLTEAELNGPGAVGACKIGAGFDDPENPPCARLILSGDIVKLEAGTQEAKAAKASLVHRHPSFANYTGLRFYVAKMVVDHIFFIGAYGGPTFMKPDDYFARPQAQAVLV